MKFLKNRDVKSPTRGTSKSAGIDLYIPNDYESKTLFPGESVLIPAGLKANIPENHAFIAFNKSGVSTKKHLVVGACVIDEDYQGEIHIHIFNHSNKESVNIEPGEKIIQCVLVPVKYDSIEMVDTEEDLWNGEVTERGTGGFGSTNEK
jgi:dUTP pyrophosphatase